MAPKIGIPVLDFSPNDVLTKEAEMLDYFLAFICSNPGNTSELNEPQMGSLGHIDAKYGHDANILTNEYESYFQGLLNSQFGHGVFEVKFIKENISENEYRLSVRVLNSNGQLVYTKNKFIEKVIELQDVARRI